MKGKLLDDNKEGLQSLSLSQVNQTISDEVFASAKHEMRVRKSRRTTTKMQSLEEEYCNLSQTRLSAAKLSVDKMLEELRAEFSPAVIVILDFDCFFAAVEMRDNPSLRDKPLAVVGGGIVCTSNYHARRYGIRSAMPIRVAKTLCAELICIDSVFDKYARVSRSCAPIFAKYDPNFVMLGCDECSLDVTDLVNREFHTSTEESIHISSRNCGRSCNFVDHTPSPFEYCVASIVQRLRNEIQELTRLTVSCGVALNRELAKIGADLRKPDGESVTELRFSDEYQMFEYFKRVLAELPVRKIWGIGEATEELLAAPPFKVIKMKHIIEKEYEIEALLPPSSINLVIAAHGLSNIWGLEEEDNMKSLGHAETFQETGDSAKLRQVILNISKTLCSELEALELKARKMQITLRFADWTDQEHVDDLPHKSRDLDVIYDKAIELLDNMMMLAKLKRCYTVTVGMGANKWDVPAYYVRLIGIRLCEFKDEHDGAISEFLKNGRFEKIRKTHLDGEEPDFEVVGRINLEPRNKPRLESQAGAIDRFITRKEHFTDNLVNGQYKTDF